MGTLVKLGLVAAGAAVAYGLASAAGVVGKKEVAAPAGKNGKNDKSAAKKK